MRRGPVQSILSNPVLIGAVTVLVIVVAVYLAYNATRGLPFVPTYELNVKVPNAGKLVKGNDVREGGYRIGVVDRIEIANRRDGSVGAVVRLKLDKPASPVPVDSQIMIRPRSALGLKYVALLRGRSRRMHRNGDTLTVGPSANTIELEDFFGIFDRPTRVDAQTNLSNFGGVLTARGVDINRTVETLPEFLAVLGPVTRNLADPETALGMFLRELSDAARIASPVADSLAAGFTSGADVFEAFSRHPDRLALTISRSPSTLDVGTASFRAQRPFLRHLAGVSEELRGAAVQLRVSLPSVNAALLSGTRVLPRTPELNSRLALALNALDNLAGSPTSQMALVALTDTVSTLNPMVRYLGPFVTVCNYWNYWWTFLSDHLTDQDSTGQIQRILGKSAGPQDDALGTFGADNFANGEGYEPIPPDPTNPERSELGDPAHLHFQQYGAAIDAEGRADCEAGQRGYPRRLAHHADRDFDVALEPHTPGRQGTTFRGNQQVPSGQTFDAIPDSRTARR